MFSWFGFSISDWRKIAISKLRLEPGNTVVDIGCGTGLNFPYLQQDVGMDGKIIGVDISSEMLVEAGNMVVDQDWKNVELVCSDAQHYVFPQDIDAVLSTYAMILIPNGGQVIRNASEALSADARMAIFDMAWPESFPLWWRHVLFFLELYGVTDEILSRRPWEKVQNAMEEYLTDFVRIHYWFGFFYLCCGTKK
jgi:demethylmenaquinone methyltransferase/2-methoxy-6-polyprenyl-1,4-benzoquinol methylase